MKKNIVIILIFLLITFLYFSFPLLIMPDSVEYYSYLKIFYGVNSLATWDVVRGPVLPFLLFIITLLFGDSMLGLLLGTYIFFIIFVIIYYKVIDSIIKKMNPSKFKLIFIWSIFLIFIIFNPILFGYFHSLLTEFVIILIALISCLISWEWININFYDNKKKYVIFNLIISFLFLFSWFLKQPYFSVVFFPFLIANCISIFKHFNFKNIIQRLISFSLSICVLILAIIGWGKFLIHNNVNYSNSRNNEYFLSKAMINGISNFRVSDDLDNITINEILKDKYIKKNEKEKLISIVNGENTSYDNFKIINVISHSGNLIDRMVFYYNGFSYSSKDSLIFLFNCIIKHPFVVLDSYYSGYLATIDIYVSSRDDVGNYYPIKVFSNFNHENNTIGLALLTADDNFLWIKNYHYDKVGNLYMKNNASNYSKTVMGLFSNINLVVFKILFCGLPLLLIYFIFKYKTILKINDKKCVTLYELIIILFGLCFFHTLFHVVTGAIIDRYAYIIFPELILGCILILMLESNKKNKISKIKINDGQKVIFVIPAYNEEKSIGKVIDEIKKEMFDADIIIINDCSTDNTPAIVKNKNIKCLNLPFNLGYAMALQTGLKYAFENDYDYVIQFDADGQHIAKEARKLLNKMMETKCDIVIGSRFLGKNDYKHGFFRKIGTKMFSFMILLLCEERITDPTSGFQCLNKRVIKRYLKMGNYPKYPDANLIIEMLMEGYKIEEISVKMRTRKNGESMHGGVIKPIKYMIKIFYTIIIILIRNIGYKRKRK